MGELGRYHRIGVDFSAVERVFVESFLRSRRKAPRRIVLDVDATDIRLHGDQEGRFFRGYYDHYCYLPLYIFCGDDLLWAHLRTANRNGADGCVEALAAIVGQLRQKWPRTEIVIRADSGFAHEPLMSWCEDHHVRYVLGLAKNLRLWLALAPAFEQAYRHCERTGRSARVFAEWQHQTLDS